MATLADKRLGMEHPDCRVQLPAAAEPSTHPQHGGATLAQPNTLSPSAGSDETSRTSILNSATLSLQTSPTMAASPALLPGAPLLSGAAAGAPCSSAGFGVLPDAAQSARTVELPGGGTVDLPSGAPPALRQMFDTPGGSRALQLAARSLLRNNPILQHPGASRP